MVGMGDVKVAERADFKRLHERVRDTCSKALKLPTNQENCSGFAKDVATRLGVSLGSFRNGQANDIYDEVKNSPWIRIGTGSEGARRAPYYASRGFLVLAVRKDGSNGHVAVVTGFRELTPGQSKIINQNVAASWGHLHDASKAGNEERITKSWRTSEFADVLFVAHPIMKFSDK